MPPLVLLQGFQLIRRHQPAWSMFQGDPPANERHLEAVNLPQDAVLGHLSADENIEQVLFQVRDEEIAVWSLRALYV